MSIYCITISIVIVIVITIIKCPEGSPPYDLASIVDVEEKQLDLPFFNSIDEHAVEYRI